MKRSALARLVLVVVVVLLGIAFGHIQLQRHMWHAFDQVVLYQPLDETALQARGFRITRADPATDRSDVRAYYTQWGFIGHGEGVIIEVRHKVSYYKFHLLEVDGILIEKLPTFD